MKIYPDGGRRLRKKKEKLRKKEERTFLGLLSCLLRCIIYRYFYIGK